MPTALYSAKIDSDGRVRVIHIFLAANDKEAEKLLEEHAKGCAKFGPAVKDGKTIDLMYAVDTLPEADEESIAEFIDPDAEDDEDEEDAEEEDDDEEDEEEK